MNEKIISEILCRFFISTPDNRLVGEKENRFNKYMFSYTGKSGLKYTSPRKIRWPNGGLDKRDLMSDRIDELSKSNKPISDILTLNDGYGFEFPFDKEIIIINDNKLWLDILAKKGLTYSTIGLFNEKYKKKNLKKNFFKNALDKRYHRLDLYDPIRHLNIEHDGDWCHIPELDEARDEFIHTKFPDIIIKRIVNFDPRKRPECKNELAEFLNKYNTPLYDSPRVFRYDDYVIKQQLLENNVDIQFILDCVNSGIDLSRINKDLANDLNQFIKNNEKSLKNLINA